MQSDSTARLVGDLHPHAFLAGRVKWHGWESTLDGIRVQLARPVNVTVSQSRCAGTCCPSTNFLCEFLMNLPLVL